MKKIDLTDEAKELIILALMTNSFRKDEDKSKDEISLLFKGSGFGVIPDRWSALIKKKNKSPDKYVLTDKARILLTIILAKGCINEVEIEMLSTELKVNIGKFRDFIQSRKSFTDIRKFSLMFEVFPNLETYLLEDEEAEAPAPDQEAEAGQEVSPQQSGISDNPNDAK